MIPKLKIKTLISEGALSSRRNYALLSPLFPYFPKTNKGIREVVGVELHVATKGAFGNKGLGNIYDTHLK